MRSRKLAPEGAKKIAAAILPIVLVWTLAGCSDNGGAVGPKGPTVTRVSFSSIAVPGTSASTSVQLSGDLHMPSSDAQVPAVVILPSSAGVQPYRETYYAQAFVNAGMAALVVRSFEARGVSSAITDQSAVTSYQLEADAFGALHYLRGSAGIRHNAIAVMGVSKGGTAALNSAFLIREVWRGTSARFAAHIAVSPDCTTPHRSVDTTGAPILLMLAEEDDYTSPERCREYATRISSVAEEPAIIELAGAAHGWERLEPRSWIAAAENFSQCAGTMEDSGRISVEGEDAPLTTAEYIAWARSTCVTLGAHTGGGTTALRDAATTSMLDFLVDALDHQPR